MSGAPASTIFSPARSVLGRLTMPAYDLPALKSSPCVGTAPEWQNGIAHRALKIGWTSPLKLTGAGVIGGRVRSTHRQSGLHSWLAPQPASPSQASPASVSMMPSPQRGATKRVGGDLDARSTPRMAWQPGSMVALSRTFAGPQVFFGHEAVTFVPRFVPRSRTCTAGQYPAIAIVDVPPSTTTASGTATVAPARSGGAPGAVTNRPSRHTGGFGGRADAVPKEHTSAATTATASRIAGLEPLIHWTRPPTRRAERCEAHQERVVLLLVDCRVGCKFPEAPCPIRESPDDHGGPPDPPAGQCPLPQSPPPCPF